MTENDGWRERTGSSSEYYVARYVEEIDNTWHESRRFCLDHGGDLASIHDAEEHAWITSWVRIYIYQAFRVRVRYAVEVME